MGLQVAVIGAGFTGATAALTLAQEPGIDVSLYDQGRRGPGGRASHRLVDVASRAVLAEGNSEQKESASSSGGGATHFLRFDHGCQFFTAHSDRFKRHVEGWTAAGVAAAWQGQFASVPSGGADALPDGDFFESCSNAPLYTGIKGMDKIVKHIAQQAVAAGAQLHSGVRVSHVERLPVADGSDAGGGGQWQLLGVGGEAAFHDSQEAVAAAASHHQLGLADVIVVTDASCSFGGWHRASAGISTAAPDITRAVQSRARVPLFTAMVAFASRVAAAECDSLVVRPSRSSKLWYAARNSSKNEMQQADAQADGNTATTTDCWTLVSTPRFAVDEISSTTMQDPTTGAFRPQEDSYLNGAGGPSQQLLEAFADALKELTSSQDDLIPRVIYLQGQRWGSAFPSPLQGSITTVQDGGDVHYFTEASGNETTPGRVRVLDVLYDSATPVLSRTGAQGDSSSISSSSNSSGSDGHNFFMDRRIGLYYAGDFCSRDTPGVEAATMSGEDAARHIIATSHSA